MTTHELSTVHIYLMDYAREHALTEAEFHLIGKMRKDVIKKYRRIIFESMTTEEIEQEHQRIVEALRHKK